MESKCQTFDMEIGHPDLSTNKVVLYGSCSCGWTGQVEIKDVLASGGMEDYMRRLKDDHDKSITPPFDMASWKYDLDALVARVLATEDQEVAIEALPYFDQVRKRMDRMQAVPPARRTTDASWIADPGKPIGKSVSFTKDANGLNIEWEPL